MHSEQSVSATSVSCSRRGGEARAGGVETIGGGQGATHFPASRLKHAFFFHFSKQCIISNTECGCEASEAFARFAGGPCVPPRTGTRAARQSSKHEPKANRRALFPRNNRRLFALFCLQAVRRKTDAANAATRSQVRSVLNSGFCGPASSHQRCVLCTKAGTDTHKATHKMTRLRLWCKYLRFLRSARLCNKG